MNVAKINAFKKRRFGMKKLISILICLMLTFGCSVCLMACDNAGSTYEIAVVTDVGQLMDKGFNQGTYEGAKEFAEANNKTFKYYQPANGSNASDNDRIAAMRQAQWCKDNSCSWLFTSYRYDNGCYRKPQR